MPRGEYDTIMITCIICEKPGLAIKTKRAKIPISHKRCKGIWRNHGRAEAEALQVHHISQIRKCSKCAKREDKEVLNLYGGQCESCNKQQNGAKLRICLMCDKSFKSLGPGNRRCNKCERVATGLALNFDRPANKTQYSSTKYAAFYE